MDLRQLPTEDPAKGGVTRYMATRAAWLPGSDLPNIVPYVGRGRHGAAFGGNVYSQGALATCRALAADEDKRGLANNERLGLHVSYDSRWSLFGLLYAQDTYGYSKIPPRMPHLLSGNVF